MFGPWFHQLLFQLWVVIVIVLFLGNDSDIYDDINIDNDDDNDDINDDDNDDNDNDDNNSDSNDNTKTLIKRMKKKGTSYHCSYLSLSPWLKKDIWTHLKSRIC